MYIEKDALKEYLEVEIENIVGEFYEEERRKKIRSLIVKIKNSETDKDFKQDTLQKLNAIKGLTKKPMEAALNKMYSELANGKYKRGGGFNEAYNFNDAYGILLKGKPANRNKLYVELEETFPDSNIDKINANSIEIFVSNNQMPRLKKLARLFNMTLTYSRGDELKNGGNLSSKQQAKFDKVMSEWGKNELHSGSKDGPLVKDQGQAVAIAFAEARKMSSGGTLDSDVNNLSGKYVEFHYMGVSEPEMGKIENAKLASPNFRYRDLFIRIEGDTLTTIPSEKVDDFLKGKMTYVKDSQGDEYAVKLSSIKMKDGGNVHEYDFYTMWTRKSNSEKKLKPEPPSEEKKPANKNYWKNRKTK